MKQLFLLWVTFVLLICSIIKYKDKKAEIRQIAPANNYVNDIQDEQWTLLQEKRQSLLREKCKEFGIDGKPVIRQSLNLQLDPTSMTAYCFLRKGDTEYNFSW